MSMSHIRAFVIEQFANVLISPGPISEPSKLKFTQPIQSISEPVKQILLQLFQVQAIFWILKYGGDFVRHAALKVSHELIKSGVELRHLDHLKYGTLANWVTKFKAFEYQLLHSIDYMCLLEDDVVIEEGFHEYIDSLLPKLSNDVKLLTLQKDIV